MKKEIEVERWFCAKGTNKYFKTGSEAAEYARTEYAKDLLRQIQFAYDVRNECVKQIKAMRVMIEEAKSKTLDLSKAWEVRASGTFPSLYSKKAGASMKLFIDVDLVSRKGLCYLREIVIYHGREEIKKHEEKIRHYKAAIKELSRNYQNLREDL